MKKATKGTWVEIENIVLNVGERAPQVPEDTKKTPLVMWTKGLLVDEEAEIGEEVSVKTLSDRVAKGKMTAINPRFEHDFGKPVDVLIETGISLKKEMGGIR
ncbi:MAG TPA: 2-amino-4-oxopentanoate thiolase subunit OrtA [Clostridia bacterium]|nr:2-amino-4-oxopentanoate thiolase subunit OrtA [Clostridia bacterium]